VGPLDRAERALIKLGAGSSGVVASATAVVSGHCHARTFLEYRLCLSGSGHCRPDCGCIPAEEARAPAEAQAQRPEAPGEPALRGSGRAIVAIALGSLCACARLPEVGDNECGNGVIEPPEDCDTFAVGVGAVCRLPGSVGACRLDCSPGGAGPGGCPDGWGCDLGGLCRRPTGGFEAPSEFEVGTADSLASEDFDGDGRADVLSAEPQNERGNAHIKFHYFDERGALDETRSFPHLLRSPAIAQMTANDDRSDVVFSDGRIGMLLGRADRSWVPETFSSYRFPNTAIRTLSVRDAPVDQAEGFLVFAIFEDVSGVYVADPITNGVRRVSSLPVPIDGFVGDPVAAQVIEGTPCKQALLAVRGESRFSMLDGCVLAPDGNAVWRPELQTQVVPLDPPEPIVHGPQGVDINGDGHLDVIVGSAERTFVAYGDGVTLAMAVPYALPVDPVDLGIGGDAGVTGGDAGVTGGVGTSGMPLPMPLAAGDVTGDGVVDFALPNGLLLSRPPPARARYEYQLYPGGAPRWTVAAIADLNANGRPDVIAGSSDRPGLDFFNGTGKEALTFFTIPTTRPVQRMTVGDFDGDLIEDLAFTQDGGTDQGETQVMISFGTPFGSPLPSVAVARLRNVEQLAAYREFDLSHLLLASAEGADQDRRGVLTVLEGSGDRMPVALYELNTFASDGRVNESTAVRVLAGAFTTEAPGDVLAIGFDELIEPPALDFWLLPQLGNSAGTPVRLSGALPADARPFFDGTQGYSVTTASADVDGDGRDEALLGLPRQDDDHCALWVLDVEPDRVTIRSELDLAEPCARGQLVPVPDGNGRVDIAWLTSRLDGDDRRLSIFWNDGAGLFSIDRRTVVGGAALAPQAFALLPATGARGTTLAYATPAGLELVAIEPSTRALGTPVPLFPLAGCTGMTAADVNGDGAVDLVAAARGNLNVLAASLEAL
jgi:hypothetical protein